MSVDYQQLRNQITSLCDKAHLTAHILQEQREKAEVILYREANNLLNLARKVTLAVNHNPNLRTAFPKTEPLDGRFPLPSLPEAATLLAADGSQINPNRHAAVDYYLVNIGAIQVTYGQADAPLTQVHTHLHYDQDMYINTYRVTEQYVALTRDLAERILLAELAAHLPRPVITLTDGPLELWVGRDIQAEELSSAYDEKFTESLENLRLLHRLGASTAGYVDRPSSDLVVRLLEIASLPDDQLDRARGQLFRPLTDADLYYPLLQPGERSAVFSIQSRMSARYDPNIALCFFYLNVGRPGHPYLARVEIPTWVVETPGMLDGLHAALVHQCSILGLRPYPYLLHRAHEVAVVTRDEQQQIESMIILELQRRGIWGAESSNKQAAKDASGDRRRFGQ